MTTATHTVMLRFEPLECRALLAFTPMDVFVEAPNPQTNSFFGGIVSVSGDYAVVGAAYESSTGAAYVYERVGDDWVQQARLAPSGLPPLAAFGTGVAIDGDRILVSATFDNALGKHSGSVYVYRREGDVWTEEAKLLASDGSSGQWFGSYVDLDGEYAVIGAQRDSSVAGSAGAAYVFQRSGTTWTQVSKLVASDGGMGDIFGTMVAVSGTTILVGAPAHDGADVDAGAAYVFDLVGASWTQTAKIVASDAIAGMRFGVAVDLDGQLAVIGSPYDNSLGPDAGSAYVFRRSGSTWTEEVKLASDQSALDLFGRSVAIRNGDVLIGSPFEDEAGQDAGAVYYFRQQGDVWVLVTKYAAESPSSIANFGWHVSISGDYFFVGAPLDSGSVPTSGLAYPGNFRSPAFSQANLTVVQGGLGTINSEYLSTSVPTWPSSSIIYTLTSDVQNGTLFLNGVSIGSGASFTQADIDAGLLIYVHDGGATTGDTFDFYVSNSDGNLLVEGTFRIFVILPDGPDFPPSSGPALTNLIAPFPPSLDRPEPGLAFDPPIPDDIYSFTPSVGGPSVGRRFLTGDQIILAQAAAAGDDELLIPQNLPGDLFRAAERLFEAITWPRHDEEPPAERPEAPRGPDAEPPRLDSSSVLPTNAADAVFVSQTDEDVSLLVLESFVQYHGQSRLPDDLFTDGKSAGDIQSLLAAILLVPMGRSPHRKQRQAPPVANQPSVD